MMFFKTKLFLFFILLATVGTFYYFGDPQKLWGTIAPKLKQTPLSSVVEKFETIDTKEISSGFQDGVQTAESEIFSLSEKTVTASKHAGNVLGSSITQATQEATPIHEKAFEYGKYVYCKQVVDDYETINPTLRE